MHDKNTTVFLKHLNVILKYILHPQSQFLYCSNGTKRSNAINLLNCNDYNLAVCYVVYHDFQNFLRISNDTVIFRSLFRIMLKATCGQNINEQAFFLEKY